MVTKKMMTKSLICMGFVTLMAQSTATANPTQLTPATTGFYGGVAVGAAALTGKINARLTRNNAGDPLSLNYNMNTSDKNINGDLFIGYGKKINCFWLAIEALASVTSLDSKNLLDLVEPNNAQTFSTRTTNAWGGSVNIGGYISPTQKIYAKLGIEVRKFTVRFRDPAIPPEFVDLNAKHNSPAFVPGLGFEVDLTPRFSMRTEYRVAFHGKKVSEVSGVSPLVTSIKTRPNIHYFNVGFVVKI